MQTQEINPHIYNFLKLDKGTMATQTRAIKHSCSMTQPFHNQVYTQENVKHVSTEMYTKMFTAALFMIAKKWKQPE